MLSAASLERINGHATKIFRDAAVGYAAGCTCDCGEPPVNLWAGWFYSETRALEVLRERVLAEHSMIVMNEANWQCKHCGKVTGLSAHHVKFRSHGRDDRIANLAAVCEPCHTLEHHKVRG